MNDKELKLGKLIGEGSFGRVYEITGTNKVVKYVHLTGNGFSNYLEPYILTNIKRKTIVDAIGISVTEKGLMKIAQVKGIDLDKLSLKKTKRDKNLIYDHIKDGLTYLHSRGILHGDIKPGNVIYFPQHSPSPTDTDVSVGEGDMSLGEIDDTSGIYKINDFSFSMLMEFEPQYISKTIYSKNFRPPEAEDQLISFRSDVYAFGKMMSIYFEGIKKNRRDIDRMMEENFKKRPYFTSVRLVTDKEICEKNKNLSISLFPQFYKKLRNREKVVSSPNLYVEGERLWCNKLNFKIEF